MRAVDVDREGQADLVLSAHQQGEVVAISDNTPVSGV